MPAALSPLTRLKTLYSKEETSPDDVIRQALARSCSNAGKNVYLAQNPEWTLAEARSLAQRFRGEKGLPLLYGIPISLKDCFDLEGFRTTCGSRFYAEANGIASRDSWVAERLRGQGAIITGKTHLHQLAYGITGENREYGDCVQPRDASRLTGGSSSGAAASVQEGSAIAAIGTDTGGSVRAPAALCGLAGYRSSVGVGDWRGGWHLAPSFDTIGWLFEDLRDASSLAEALFGIVADSWPEERIANIGTVGPDFAHDCDPEITTAFEDLRNSLPNAQLRTADVGFFRDSFEIFSAIQAHEAAKIHAGHYDRFETSIAERLSWGASIPDPEITQLRKRHAQFNQEMEALFRQHDFVLAPCCPVTALLAGADNSAARQKILRYTTPASLGGNPVVAIPFGGTAFQLIARRDEDRKLLGYASVIAEKFART